jgi:lipid-A-disaccharide synthase-like uncharacterized protein
MLVFSLRFVVQWYATEKKQQVVVPVLFWWLSLAGSWLLLAYAVFYDKHLVVILTYAVAWIPYIRNLIIQRRQDAAHRDCPQCSQKCPPQANYCPTCGEQVVIQSAVPAN